ncbi:MAG: hypothetical protein UHO11_07715 [Treponema sp.]|nr:hypothetical protein [Treponema sp.]
MSNKNINIKIKANSDDAEKGINKVTSKINSLKKQINLSTFAKLGSAVSGLGVAFNAVTKSIQLVSSVIKDLNTSALNQIKAEKQLEAAAKNNPYLNKSNVSQLKEFAGQLQKVGTIGDEELLPMMSRLAAAGRTQTEIQDIMSAALDLSASGAMDMNSAVNALNSTLNGTTGTLGRQVSGIKDLTQEELKSGKAIELVAKQYKGMAAESAKAVGAGQQFKNAWGDLKEQLGMGFAKVSAPVLRFFTGIVEKVTDFAGGVNKLMGIENKTSDIKPSDSIKNQLEEIKKESSALEEKIKALESAGGKTTEQIVSLADEEKRLVEVTERYNELKEKGKERTEEETNEYKKLRKEKNNLTLAIEEEKSLQGDLAVISSESIDGKKELIELEKKQSDLLGKKENLEKQLTEALKEEQEIAKANSAEQKYIDENYKAREAEIAQIRRSCEAKRQAGEEVSALEEQQQIYNAYLQSYIKLVTDANGLDIESTGIIQKRLVALKKESDKLSEITAQSANDEHFKKLVEQFSVKEVKDQMTELKDSLVELQDLQKNTDLVQSLGLDPAKVSEAINQCQESIDSLDFQKTLESAQNVGNVIVNALSVVNSAVTSIAERELESIKSEAEEKQDILEKLYESGACSYEEYVLKKQELDRETAQKEYEMNLAKWTMELAMGQAQAAMAVITALASAPPPLNFINAGIAGAAATVQLATMLANRPQRPSFETGGIVPGTSYTGDHVQANVNSGEMILTQKQQKALWNMANSSNTQSGGNLNIPINITNELGEYAQIEPSFDGKQINILVKKSVSEGLLDGSFSRELKFAVHNLNGTRLS